MLKQLKDITGGVDNKMDHSEGVIRSFGTIREMFVDRAKHDPNTWDSKTINDVTDDDLVRYCLSQTFVISLDNNIRIVYMLQAKFKVQDFKKLITNSKLQINDVILLVTMESLTSSNIKTLKNTCTNIQMFPMRDLLTNKTKHELVPLHEVMNDAEIAELMEKFNIKAKATLPHIQSSDPIARYLALRPGQVVRITRSSPSAAECQVYRYCV